jgi:hypothetical protein
VICEQQWLIMEFKVGQARNRYPCGNCSPIPDPVSISVVIVIGQKSMNVQCVSRKQMCFSYTQHKWKSVTCSVPLTSIEGLTSPEGKLTPTLSFLLELPLSRWGLLVPRCDPTLELVPGEDVLACCFFLTNGSNMPRASAKLAPVNPNALHGGLPWLFHITLADQKTLCINY